LTTRWRSAARGGFRREDPGLRLVRLRLFPLPRPPGAQSLIDLGVVKSVPDGRMCFKAVDRVGSRATR
jgi:hypothetical protein